MEGFGFQYRDHQITVEITQDDKIAGEPPVPSAEPCLSMVLMRNDTNAELHLVFRAAKGIACVHDSRQKALFQRNSGVISCLSSTRARPEPCQSIAH